jgi:hypothetical protein
LKTNIHFLIEDTDMLAKAASEGKLGTRADANKRLGGLSQDRGTANLSCYALGAGTSKTSVWHWALGKSDHQGSMHGRSRALDDNAVRNLR